MLQNRINNASFSSSYGACQITKSQQLIQQLVDILSHDRVCKSRSLKLTEAAIVDYQCSLEKTVHQPQIQAL